MNSVTVLDKEDSLQLTTIKPDEKDILGNVNTVDAVKEAVNAVDASIDQQEKKVPQKDSNCPFFLCRNSHCVPNVWRCDLIDDCGDGSDEEGCNARFCNTTTEFRCQSGMCIPKAWMCDWIKDCPYEDDEANC